MLENQQDMASRYAIRKAKSKDMHTEALGYKIRNKKVMGPNLSFQGAGDKKFKESLVPPAEVCSNTAESAAGAEMMAG